jgi:4-carboxymuconolactone decarboxylase
MAPGKKPRFSQLTMEQLNNAQRPLGEQIMKVSRIGLRGPYNPMLRSPVFGQKMFDLLYYLRWQTSVPLKLNEFAILIIGRQWRSQVEWFAHAPPPSSVIASRDVSAPKMATEHLAEGQSDRRCQPADTPLELGGDPVAEAVDDKGVAIQADPYMVSI